ncbi:mite group 2 allergen Lep d 2-like [Tetranychus urticae]|uniref:MD-2-related lipid-recognition domain-containing protein n=1 Tax=Tetranychus urticae TaxID=32264 RepID=T1KL99_TETUR|nr:mite group 2 allergen Lep d 2-like [Tetranychus urticae]
MIRTIAIFALFVACAQARNISFTNCASNGKIINVNVVPCDSDPCDFEPGQEVKLNGSFVSYKSESNPVLKTEVKMGNSWVQYPDVDTDACKYTSCPVKANNTYAYNVTLKVINWPVSFETEMRFRLLDSDEDTELVCGNTTIKVSNN